MSEPKILTATCEDYFDEHYTGTNQFRLKCSFEDGTTKYAVIVDSDHLELAIFIETLLNKAGKKLMGKKK